MRPTSHYIVPVSKSVLTTERTENTEKATAPIVPQSVRRAQTIRRRYGRPGVPLRQVNPALRRRDGWQPSLLRQGFLRRQGFGGQVVGRGTAALPWCLCGPGAAASNTCGQIWYKPHRRASGRVRVVRSAHVLCRVRYRARLWRGACRIGGGRAQVQAPPWRTRSSGRRAAGSASAPSPAPCR